MSDSKILQTDKSPLDDADTCPKASVKGYLQAGSAAVQEEALDASLHLEMKQNPSGLEAHPFYLSMSSQEGLIGYDLQDRGRGCKFISFDSREEATCIIALILLSPACKI